MYFQIFSFFSVKNIWTTNFRQCFMTSKQIKKYILGK